MCRGQKVLAGDGAMDVIAFVQPDKLRIHTKYLILGATNVTQFGAEIMLIIWDSLNKH
jgi:hypothetical protein